MLPIYVCFKKDLHVPINQLEECYYSHRCPVLNFFFITLFSFRCNRCLKVFHKEAKYKMHMENPDSCSLGMSKKAALEARKVRNSSDKIFHVDRSHSCMNLRLGYNESYHQLKYKSYFLISG